MRNRDNNTMVAVVAALTLLGAVTWTSSVIVAGFAAVALWRPLAAAARRTAFEAEAVPRAGAAPRST